MPEADLEKARREAGRWRILRLVNSGSYLGINESLLLAAINDVGFNFSPTELRRELDYLRDRGLIEIEREDGPEWIARILRTGVDVVEYTIPCEPGIARPKRY